MSTPLGNRAWTTTQLRGVEYPATPMAATCTSRPIRRGHRAPERPTEPTVVAVEPNQAHALRPQLLDEGQAVDREARVESDPLVTLLELSHEGLSRSLPNRLQLWMRPAARMGIQIVVRKAMITGEVTSESALSCRRNSGGRTRFPSGIATGPFTSTSANGHAERHAERVRSGVMLDSRVELGSTTSVAGHRHARIPSIHAGCSSR